MSDQKELLEAKTQIELLRSQVKFLESLSESNEALMKYWKRVASDLHHDREVENLSKISCFANLPAGTTHVGRVIAYPVASNGFEARFYAYKQDGDKLLVYLTDSDNEFGQWVDRAKIFRDQSAPQLYPV